MGDEDADVRIWLTRLETKLDVVIDQHESKIDDHEDRIRTLESRPAGITGNKLIASAGACVALIVSILAILDRLYG